MDNHQIFPTARRCARTLALRGAPESTVGDVPTPTCDTFVLTGSHARARRPRELRRTGQRLLSLLPLMLAAQHHSSKFTVRTVGRRGPRDATAKVGRRFFELNRGIEPGEPPFDLRILKNSLKAAP